VDLVREREIRMRNWQALLMMKMIFAFLFSVGVGANWANAVIAGSAYVLCYATRLLFLSFF
jgi:hypothetical protein